MKKTIGLAVSILTAAMALPTLAADYPTKPMTAIVSWPAGGGTDIAARTILGHAEKQLKQTINVRNIEGGGGAIGYVQGARLAPNGYNLMVMQFDILSIASQKIAPISYKDFDLVSIFADQPVFVFVSAKSDIKTIDDLIAASKSRTLKMAGASIGGVNHQASSLVEKELGIKYTYVPYKGVTGILPAVLGQEADAGVAFVTGMGGSIDSGDIRLLAVMADQRAANYPDVPTFAELGYPVSYAGFYGLAVPKGTNPAEIKVLEAAMLAGCKEKQYEEEATKLGLNPKCLGAGEFARYLDGMYPKVDEISKSLLQQ